MHPFKKLSILIPAYNEGRTIHLILDRIGEVQLVNNLEMEIVIVNDASTDNTVEAIESYIAAHPERNFNFYSQPPSIIQDIKGAVTFTFQEWPPLTNITE